MLGITPFGMFHTVISLVSLFAGLYSLVRYYEVRGTTRLGKTYILGTIGSCVTGFFIVRHGGFSEAHGLGIVTLVVLLVAWLAERGAAETGLRRCVAVMAYTLTVFFHFIPGFNETLTRIPVGNPLLTGPDDPLLFRLVSVTLVVFLTFGALQVQRLRRPAAGTSPAA